MTSDGLVYVIDDDASVRRALARLIASAGLDVETFPSAEAFLHHPAADRPACLVLDVRLPGESGLELQAALGDARRFLPIIFVTGHGTVSAERPRDEGGRRRLPPEAGRRGRSCSAGSRRRSTGAVKRGPPWRSRPSWSAGSTP